MSGCKKIKKLIYLDIIGELLPGSRAKIERHVARCENCRIAMKEVRELVRHMNSDAFYPSEKEIPWESFVDGIFYKIQAHSSERGEKAHNARWPHFSWKAIMIFSPLFAIFILSFLFLYWTFWSESPIRSVAGGFAHVQEEVERKLRLEIAKQATADYLREGREILLNLAGNIVPCHGGKVDITVEKEKIGSVLKKKNYLSDFLRDPEMQWAAPLCCEMETLLLDASSLQSCTSKERLQELEETILKRNLLMKIEVITGELGYEEKIKHSL